MENNVKKDEIKITRGDLKQPSGKTILKDRRSKQQDRRKLDKYVANDRRTGKADRRKKGSGKK
jgi:hypothetical protein